MTVEWESTHGKGDVQKTALIAGGAKGIGREVGLRLAERGWAVALCYRKSRAEAEATALAIEDKGGRALAVAGQGGRRAEARPADREGQAPFILMLRKAGAKE